MDDPDHSFLLSFFQLLEGFDVEISYTRNDDGIHLSMGNQRLLDDHGFFDREELRQLLMERGVLLE